MSNSETSWKAYERTFPNPTRLRNFLLPPSLTKRHFIIPRLNLIGITIPEITIAVTLIGGLVALGISQRTTEAESSGNVASLLWIPMLLFITYRSVMEWIFSISFERSMFWHGYLAILATSYGVWHGVAAMYWAELDDDDGGVPIRGWAAYTSGELQSEFLTGGILSIIMIVIVVTSFHPIRKIVRRLWLWSHHVIPVAAIVFALLHGAGVVLVGFAVYLADRLFGYIFQSFIQYRQMGSEGTAELLESGLVRLSFPNKVSFQPGQYMCLQIPTVSLIEYHTYSITSSPTDARISFLIQQDGRWTRKLARQIAAKNGEGPIPIPARLHGPIGSIGLDWQSSTYEMFVLIAGGIGITPLISLYRHLANQKQRGRPLKSTTLIWCVRDEQMVSDCVQTLAIANKKHSDTDHSPSAVDVEMGVQMEGFETRIFVTKRAPNDVSFPYHAPASSVEGRVLGDVVWHAVRPDIKAELERVRGIAVRNCVKRVAVLGCGPGGLTAELCQKALGVSSREARLDVHLEHFY